MIQKEKEYIIIYVEDEFFNSKHYANRNFEGVEIPYVDNDKIPYDVACILRNYIYIEDNDSMRTNFDALKVKFRGMEFVVQGLIRGQDILDNIEEMSNTLSNKAIINKKVKLNQGEFKNVIATISNVQDSIVTVEIKSLEDVIQLKVPMSHICFDIEEFNKHTHRYCSVGTLGKKAIILDGDHAVFRAMTGKTYSRIYKTENNEYVGGGLGFYFTLVRLKEMYPEYEIHVVFGKGGHEYLSGYSEGFKQFFFSNTKWAQELTKSLGYYNYHIKNKRVCDVIASVRECLLNQDYEEILIQGVDSRYFQLVNEKTSVLFPKNKSRWYTKIVTNEFALSYFKVNSIHKINWVLAALEDNTSDSVNVNDFWKQSSNLKKIKRNLLIQAANESSDLNLFKSKVRSQLKEDVFDSYLKDFKLKNTLLDKYKYNLDIFKKEYQEKKVRDCLESFSFFRELEMFDKVSNILQGMIVI